MLMVFAEESPVVLICSEAIRFPEVEGVKSMVTVHHVPLLPKAYAPPWQVVPATVKSLAALPVMLKPVIVRARLPVLVILNNLVNGVGGVGKLVEMI